MDSTPEAEAAPGMRPLHVAMILLAAALPYLAALGAPLHFDDRYYIERNPIVKDPALALRPWAQPPEPLHRDIASTRYTRLMGYLTFSADHTLGGRNPRGYRAFNIAIHAACSALLYGLVLTMLRRVAGDKEARYALLGALVFALHPIQTQAVTYVSQRFASMASMFYMGSVLLYARHLAGAGRERLAYALALASALAAMLTKEIAFTLPLMIGLYDLGFARCGEGRLRRLAPFLMMMPLIPMLLVLGDGAAHALAPQQRIGRWDYLLTQPRVIFTYLRLVLLPMNQSLEYDYPLLTWPQDAWEGLMYAVPLAAAGLWLLRKRLGGMPGWPGVAAMGGLWFLLALSVESSVVPLEDLIFEHRLYLPMAGVGMMAAALASWSGDAIGRRGPPIAMALMLLAFLCALTMHRNGVWSSDRSLWEDAAAKAPGKGRPHYNLGIVYEGLGMIEDAGRELERTVALAPLNAEAHNALGLIHEERGRPADAERMYVRAIGLDPDFARPHFNLGVLYMELGMEARAGAALREALRLDPRHAQAAMFLRHLERSGVP